MFILAQCGANTVCDCSQKLHVSLLDLIVYNSELVGECQVSNSLPQGKNYLQAKINEFSRGFCILIFYSKQLIVNYCFFCYISIKIFTYIIFSFPNKSKIQINLYTVSFVKIYGYHW